MDRIYDESIWLGCPDFADVLVRHEVTECLETVRVVVGIEEIAEMRAEVVMAIVVIPFGGRVFNRAFMRSTCPFVQGWFGLVRRFSMPFAAQMMSNRMGRE